MKKLLFTVSIAFIGFSFVSMFSTGCTKETIREITHDTVIVVNKDSMAITKKLLTKKWTLLAHEYELYSGNVFVSKKFENFSASNFSVEYRANGTTQNIDLGGTTNGTWQLISPSYFVNDLNTSQERYYYIINISETELVTRGPFTKNNAMFTFFLTTNYLRK